MRYTRFEFNGKVAIGHSAFRFFAFIPLIAIIMGLFLSRLFIMTAQIGQKSPQKSPVQYTYKDVSPHQYFIVQVGIYSSSDNARLAEGIIKSKGFPAYSYLDGKYYRVISYAALSKNDADTKNIEYTRHGIQSIVKELDLTPAPVPENMKKEKDFTSLNDMLNYCGEESDSCCSMYLKYESSKVDSKSVRQSLKAMDEKMEKRIQEFNAAAGSNNAYCNKMVSLCRSFQKTLTGENSGGDFSPILFQQKIISSIYIYKDIIKEYNDYINSGGER